MFGTDKESVQIRPQCPNNVVPGTLGRVVTTTRFTPVNTLSCFILFVYFKILVNSGQEEEESFVTTHQVRMQDETDRQL